MADPSMNPDELAWAFNNAGRSPEARKTTSEAFAAQARAREMQILQRKAQLEQIEQDRKWNQAVHAQDMAAARAHHNALMGEYSMVEQVKNLLPANGFVQGFFWGLVVGGVLVGVLGSKGR